MATPPCSTHHQPEHLLCFLWQLLRCLFNPSAQSTCPGTASSLCISLGFSPICLGPTGLKGSHDPEQPLPQLSSGHACFGRCRLPSLSINPTLSVQKPPVGPWILCHPRTPGSGDLSSSYFPNHSPKAAPSSTFCSHRDTCVILDCGWWSLWDKTTESHSPQPEPISPTRGVWGLGQVGRSPLPGGPAAWGQCAGVCQGGGEVAGGVFPAPDTRRSPWTPR